MCDSFKQYLVWFKLSLKFEGNVQKQVKSCYKDGYYVVKWTNGYKPHKSLSDFLEPQLSEQNEQDAEDTPYSF